MNELLILVCVVVVTPFIAGLLVGLPSRISRDVSERAVRVLVAGALSLSWLGSIVLAVRFWLGVETELIVSLGDFFHLEDYGFGVSFLVDRASIPMMLLTTTLAAIVGRFSFRYMHKEAGFI